MTGSVRCGTSNRGSGSAFFDSDPADTNKVRIERCKRGFNCYKQNEKGSGSSPQSHAKGSRGKMTERGDKSD